MFSGKICIELLHVDRVGVRNAGLEDVAILISEDAVHSLWEKICTDTDILYHLHISLEPPLQHNLFIFTFLSDLLSRSDWMTISRIQSETRF